MQKEESGDPAENTVRHGLLALKTGLARPIPLYVVVALFAGLIAVQALYASRSELQPRPANGGRDLGIEKLIKDVKTDLRNATAGDDSALFEVKEFDLEISFVVRTDLSQSGAVNYQLVTADTESSIARENVQKLTLRMSAIPPKAGSAPASSSPLSPSSDPQQIGAVPPPSIGVKR